jgi:hypothetical protein
MAGMQGELHLYRTPLLTRDNNYTQYVDKVVMAIERITTDICKRVVVNEDVMTDLYGDNIDQYEEFYKELMNRIYIRSEFQLMEWYITTGWNQVIRSIYEGFEKKITKVPGKEKFYAATFVNRESPEITHIPGTIDLADGAHLFIKQPDNSLANITRIVINKGVFLTTCEAFGYNNCSAALLWEFYNTMIGDGEVTVDKVLKVLALDGFRPVGSQDSNMNAGTTDEDRKYSIIYNFVKHLVLLRVWSMTNQSLNINDWKIVVPYHIFYENMPDAQFEKQNAILTEYWNNTQIKVPDGSLSRRLDLYILPITSMLSRGYQVERVTNEDGGTVQHDSSQYAGYPCVSFCRINFEHKLFVKDRDKPISTEMNEGKLTDTTNIEVAVEGIDTPKEDDGTGALVPKIALDVYVWVELKILNAVDTSYILSYNKVTGEIDSLAIEEEANIRVGIVYPHNFKRAHKQSITGMKFEKRHWPLIYSYQLLRNPPVSVGMEEELMFYNQQSLYGPHSYLFDTAKIFLSDSTAAKKFSQQVKNKVRDAVSAYGTKMDKEKDEAKS